MVFTDTSPFLVFTNLVYIVFLMLFTRSALSGNNFSKSKIRTCLLLILIFCIFSFWGKDWFGYLHYFISIMKGSDKVHMEAFYIWLMKIVEDYLLFRVIVWGGALFFFYHTLKNLPINMSLALFFFCSIYLIFFSYSRVSLAIAMMCYGYSYIYKISRSTNFSKLLWGVFWISLSFFCHKSAILGILAIIFATFFLKLGRRAIIWIIILYPVAIAIVGIFFQQYFSQLMSDEGTLSEYASASSVYLNSEASKTGISTILSWSLERIPYYILAFLSFKELVNPSEKHPKSIESFFALEICIVLSATLFLFDFGVNTSTIYGRLIRFAQIPSVVILAYLYANHKTQLLKWAYCIGIIKCLYSLIYSLYDTTTI